MVTRLLEVVCEAESPRNGISDLLRHTHQKVPYILCKRPEEQEVLWKRSLGRGYSQAPVSVGTQMWNCEKYCSYS